MCVFTFFLPMLKRLVLFDVKTFLVWPILLFYLQMISMFGWSISGQVIIKDKQIRSRTTWSPTQKSEPERKKPMWDCDPCTQTPLGHQPKLAKRQNVTHFSRLPLWSWSPFWSWMQRYWTVSRMLHRTIWTTEIRRAADHVGGLHIEKGVGIWYPPGCCRAGGLLCTCIQ